MFRAIYLIVCVFFFFLFQEVNFRKVKRYEREARKEEKDKIVASVMWGLADLVVKRGKLKVEVEGYENIPSKGRPYIITPNHSSLLDVPLLLYAFKRIIGFVSKKENAKIPFVGRWVTVIYSVFIDRSDSRAAIKSLNEGAKFIRAGYPQVIFPEGTRTLDGTVGEFKAGSFKLAEKAGVPVLPVAIKGGYEVMRKGRFVFKPGTIKIKIFEPIDISEMSTQEAAALVQSLIKDYVEA